MKRAKLIAALFLLVAQGCAKSEFKPPITYTRTGYVRSVWTERCFVDGCNYDILFETSSGLETISTFGSAPPVWPGMYCTLKLEWNSELNYPRWKIVKVERVP
jgi:hypothetical protein